jgi:hypothetical protein
MKEFIGSRALIFITGVLALLAGLAVVNAHNLWVLDWRLIVTILGWLLILRGIMNLVFPATVHTLGDRMIASMPASSPAPLSPSRSVPSCPSWATRICGTGTQGERVPAGRLAGSGARNSAV